jgi:hypothetical protein
VGERGSISSATVWRVNSKGETRRGLRHLEPIRRRATSICWSSRRQTVERQIVADGDAIVWRRPDANEPMRFRGMSASPCLRAKRQRQRIESEPAPAERKVSRQKPAPLRSKLPGTDWLFGEVTSKDGSAFEVKTGENSSFKIARSEVQ